MGLCRICLKEYKEMKNVFIEISKGLSMANLIARHLWFELQEDDPISTDICEYCTLSIQNFHEFYVSVENAQNCFNIKANTHDCLHKCEEDEYKHEPLDKITEIEEIPFILSAGFNGRLDINEGEEEMRDVLSDKSSDNENIKNSNLTSHKNLDCNDLREKENVDENLIIKEDTGRLSQKVPYTVDNDNELKRKSKAKNDRRAAIKIAMVAKKRGRPIKHKDSKKSLKIAKESEDYKTKIKEYDTEIAQFMTLYCDFCNKSSENFPALRRHMRDEHSITDGYVTCCDKKFTKRALLLYHIRQHLNPSYYRCEECDFTFSDRQSRHNHFLVKHQRDEDKIYACSQCSKKFVRKYLLEQHKSFSHKDFIPKCKNCSKRFKTIEELTEHRKEGCYPGTMCDICAKCIRGTAAFKRHQLEHQGIMLPKVQCDLCGLWYKDKRGLKRHKRKHLESKEPHICDICQKISPSRSAMLSHKRYAHKTKPIYKCSVCGKTFKKSISLREHMTTHTGEILYKCPYCTKTFNSNANMHSHRKKVHPKEFEETRKQRKLNPARGDQVILLSDCKSDNKLNTGLMSVVF